MQVAWFAAVAASWAVTTVSAVRHVKPSHITFEFVANGQKGSLG